MIDPLFHGDRPIQSKDGDRFGFVALAVRIAASLTSQAADKGFVFGLEGKWGSGKSSLLALVLEQLKEMDPEKVATVEFRPWLIGDRDQLLSALFEDFAKAIAGLDLATGDATRATNQYIKDAIEQVRGFAQHLGPVGKLAGVAGLFVPGASIMGDALEKVALAAAEQIKGPTLVAQKDKLAQALRDLNCRIVIAIDDVDRLEPREVVELLRLVRSVADFPNVSYLLCYDARALRQAIQIGTGVADGAAYLEKIIQTEVAVPRPESFALRRWFSDELEVFASCAPERASRLMQVIDETGGRVLESPRAVVRVLDSLRVYWPSLKDRIDLADLVWLRMIAVGSPNFYRWIEDYLASFVAISSGRASVAEAERIATALAMDEALKVDGLSWNKQMFEIKRHLPGIEFQTNDENLDKRLFSRRNSAEDMRAAKDQRLASPNHARIYFTLVEPPGTVTDVDITRLLAAASEDANRVASLLIEMGEQRGDAGATKAERLLDQLCYVESSESLLWPAEALMMGLSDAADTLASDDRDDFFGTPRVYHLARKLLKQLREDLPPEIFMRTLVNMCETSPSLGFLTKLLRNDTFGHGFYGDQPDPSDCLTTREEFEVFRVKMIDRYSAEGIDKVMLNRRAANMLYAWSQAGGRELLVKLVAENSNDDAWLLSFVSKLYGRGSELSFDALKVFFKSPAEIVNRIYSLSEAQERNAEARDAIRSIKANVHVDDDVEFANVLEGWMAAEASAG